MTKADHVTRVQEGDNGMSGLKCMWARTYITSGLKPVVRHFPRPILLIFSHLRYVVKIDGISPKIENFPWVPAQQAAASQSPEWSCLSMH